MHTCDTCFPLKGEEKKNWKFSKPVANRYSKMQSSILAPYCTSYTCVFHILLFTLTRSEFEIWLAKYLIEKINQVLRDYFADLYRFLIQETTILKSSTRNL